ncbi:MAG: SDR family NAD(P)-dependent oxidoreductase [Propionicimonas sp.]|nr:SDR family NAD(P)-dependent oxidoreductase [Propionicimonas sp.]
MSEVRGSLDGRVAVVLGATGRIGSAVCRALAAAGAEVLMIDRDAERLDALQREPGLGQRVTWVAADPSSQLEVDEARAVAQERYGGVDLLVVASGVVTGSAFEDGVPADWAEMIDVNLRGVLHATQAFADPLLAAARAGRPSDLVLLGALGAHPLSPRFAVFNAISAAVRQLARTLRQEYGPRGLRVRAIELGFVATGFGHLPTGPGGSRRHFPHASESVPPDAIAALVAITAALPAEVNVAELAVTPTTMAAVSQ